ncbi:MAG: SDR family oxidoreductase [Polyangiales bacterium]
MKRIWIAGSTGYLGAFVVQECVDAGFEVDALVRRSPERMEAMGAKAVVAEATIPASFAHSLDGVDVVISCLGITRQKDGLSYEDVDYQANLNILEAAKSAGVGHFIYVSVFRGDELRHTSMVGAKERFVEALRKSGIAYSIVRPTGFYSDMGEFLTMAKAGRAWLFGDGSQRLNPIHGADLAEAIVRLVDQPTEVLNIGGPEVLTMREIAALAFEAIDEPMKVSSVPMWVARAAEHVLPSVTPRSFYGPVEMFLAAARLSMEAPCYGSRTLADYYREVAD